MYIIHYWQLQKQLHLSEILCISVLNSTIVINLHSSWSEIEELFISFMPLNLSLIIWYFLFQNFSICTIQGLWISCWCLYHSGYDWLQWSTATNKLFLEYNLPRRHCVWENKTFTDQGQCKWSGCLSTLMEKFCLLFFDYCDDLLTF